MVGSQKGTGGLGAADAGVVTMTEAVGCGDRDGNADVSVGAHDRQSRHAASPKRPIAYILRSRLSGSCPLRIRDGWLDGLDGMIATPPLAHWFTYLAGSARTHAFTFSLGNRLCAEGQN